MTTTVPYCKIHKTPFIEVDGMGGERYIECPVGGWNCKVTQLVQENKPIDT